jgi:hypothetical protein
MPERDSDILQVLIGDRAFRMFAVALLREDVSRAQQRTIDADDVLLGAAPRLLASESTPHHRADGDEAEASAAAAAQPRGAACLLLAARRTHGVDADRQLARTRGHAVVRVEATFDSTICRSACRGALSGI